MEQGITGDQDTHTYNRGSTGQNYARWDSINISMRRDLIKKGFLRSNSINLSGIVYNRNVNEI